MLTRIKNESMLETCIEKMKGVFPKTFKRSLKKMLLDSQHVLTNDNYSYWCILDNRDMFCVKLIYHFSDPKIRGMGYVDSYIEDIINYCATLNKYCIIASVRCNNDAGLKVLLNNNFIPIMECSINDDPAIKLMYRF